MEVKCDSFFNLFESIDPESEAQPKKEKGGDDDEDEVSQSEDSSSEGEESGMEEDKATMKRSRDAKEYKIFGGGDKLDINSNGTTVE